MPLEKILLKIHGEIKDLAPTLELFLDNTVQASVKDCEVLQQQLVLLQESVAVYKFNKMNKEISPSFNIHAMVSQKEDAGVTARVNTAEEKKPVKLPVSHEQNTEPEQAETKGTTGKKYSSLVVGLNDKFRFINELFAQNNAEYHIAIEQLNNLKNWSDTEIYLNSLANLYEWRANSEVVKHFFAIVKKRFDG